MYAFEIYYISSKICNNLRDFWKGNYYIPCTALSTEDATIASEKQLRRHHTRANFPRSLLYYNTLFPLLCGQFLISCMRTKDDFLV